MRQDDRVSLGADLFAGTAAMTGVVFMPEPEDGGDLSVLIRTGIRDPIAIGLAESLLREAEIPFFAMDRNVAARQESGNVLGWWSVRVPSDLEAEAREILQSVEAMR